VAVVDLADGQVQAAQLALTGAWEERARLAESIDSLVAKSLDGGQIEEVVAAVTEEVEPPEDFLGTAEYRQTMAGVLTRRALTQCMQTGA
jgi:carbon-monoxide dehydrogenase medium subunit/6-hydroxypseudooxynicotine dehydrogenase subunit alpha